ncbi:MAG: DoxX family protein [Myxococcota bacterium]
MQIVLQALLSLIFIAAGVANLTGQMDDALQLLGYPFYLTRILGIAYLCAVVAIYQPWIKFLQDWAWSGLFISLVGAAASHMHSGIADAAPSFAIQLLLITAYLLRHHLALSNEHASPAVQR